MAERKRLDDGSARYLGLGRNLLAQLKQAMQVNRLQVLSRTIDLPDGVRITVASVFGQDEIRIDTSAAKAAQQDEASASSVDGAAQYDLVNGTVATFVACSGSIEIYAETTDTQPAYDEIILVGYLTKNGSYNNRVAFWWSSVSGWIELGIGAGGYASEAHAVSPDGQSVAGFTSGVTSQSGVMTMNSFGPILNNDTAAYQASLVTVAYATAHACGWRPNGGSLGRSAGYFYGPTAGIKYSAAYKVDNDRTTYGWGNNLNGSQFGFRAFAGLTITSYATAPKTDTPTSVNGYAVANSGSAGYTKNGSTIAIGVKGGYSFSKATAIAVIPHAAVVTTTSSTLVFSG